MENNVFDIFKKNYEMSVGYFYSNIKIFNEGCFEFNDSGQLGIESIVDENMMPSEIFLNIFYRFLIDDDLLTNKIIIADIISDYLDNADFGDLSSTDLSSYEYFSLVEQISINELTVFIFELCYLNERLKDDEFRQIEELLQDEIL